MSGYLVSTVQTFLTFYLHAIQRMFLRDTFRAILPDISEFIVRFRALGRLSRLISQRAMTRSAKSRLNVIPRFQVRLTIRAFSHRLMAALVLRLRIMVLLTILIVTLSGTALQGILQRRSAFVIVNGANGSFMQTAVRRASGYGPLLAIILRFRRINFRFTQANDRSGQQLRAITVFFFLLLIVHERRCA